tara:strand:- start:291 stop:596 length:306 start_codon:yes stop_codon:yes gene_type:complete
MTSIDWFIDARFGCYGILANAAGTHEALGDGQPRRVFGGWCGVVNPMGGVVAVTRQTGNDEQMIVTEIDFQMSADARSSGYFIPKCTRSDIYDSRRNRRDR